MLDKLRTQRLGGHVGFDSLPDQLVNKARQKGFVFNILCIGETGIGKSTLMDSLFNTTFDSTPSPHTASTVGIKAHTYELHESNVPVKLTIVDTVGYGDQVKKEDSFKSVADYIDQQFEAYLLEELKIQRCLLLYHDSRIHACLYFICPTGHGLKAIDLLCMKKLDSKVNIIPIIAKADTLSKSELQQFKEKIRSELTANGIKIYQFPVDDESVSETNIPMNAQIPFAVVGSREFVRVGNKTVRARQYPWGTVQVENESHCDFAKLREMLIRTNMEDMKEQTHMEHYELYRKTRLEQMGFGDVESDEKPKSFQETFTKTMSLHQQELALEEEDVKQQFVTRLGKKESELEQAERELHARFDQIMENNAKEKKSMEENRKRLEDEIAEFRCLRTQFQSQPQQRSAAGIRHTLSLGSLGKGKKK